jgi:hypothetical protein
MVVNAALGIVALAGALTFVLKSERKRLKRWSPK